MSATDWLAPPGALLISSLVTCVEVVPVFGSRFSRRWLDLSTCWVNARVSAACCCATVCAGGAATVRAAGAAAVRGAGAVVVGRVGGAALCLGAVTVICGMLLSVPIGGVA